MSTSAAGVLPRTAAPELAVPLPGGGTFRLADQKPERFTMVVFFRGLHCPVCKPQLRELDRRLDELTERGIEVVAVSAETEARTQRLHDEWGLQRLTIAYGLAEEQMREWGLFVSCGVKEGEPGLFNEPGLFLVRSDGSVYYESILSMPVGRPRLDDLLGGVAEDYPARGEA